jgi:25S rRNA (uracil2634-N3)-methyltransferase
VKELQKLGATVLHGVGVKEMNVHADLQLRLFDRIVFNFPHAGFNGREDNVDMIKYVHGHSRSLILVICSVFKPQFYLSIDLSTRAHQELVRGFFATAWRMFWRHGGEIHVTHKTKHPYSMWGIELLAAESSLTMLEKAAFQIQDYPGYNQKRGSSWRCDQDFAIGSADDYLLVQFYGFAYAP